MTNTYLRRLEVSPTAEVVRLWDGRDYSRESVENACPGLGDLARGRDCLEDTIPYDPAGGLREWWKIVGLFALMVGLVGVGVFPVLDTSGVILLVGAIGLSLGFGALGTLPAVFRAKRVLPTVRVREGTVEVYRPNPAGGHRLVTTYPLAQARWHLGRVREDTACRGRGGALVPNRSAVILRTPRTWKNIVPPNEWTATGSSPEMIALWQAFLRLAEVPEGH